MTDTQETIDADVGEDIADERDDIETQLLRRTVEALQKEVQVLRFERDRIKDARDVLVEENEDLDRQVARLRHENLELMEDLENQNRDFTDAVLGYKEVIAQQAIAAWYPERS